MAAEALSGAAPRVRDEILEMCHRAIEMLALTWKAFKTLDPSPLRSADKLGREIHDQEKKLTALMVQPPERGGADQELLFVPMHLERIGDNIEFLARATRTVIQESVPFTERAAGELNSLFEKALELLQCARDALVTGNRVLVRYILEQGAQHERKADEYALFHQQRLIEGVCLPKASSVYLAILDYLKGIEWHTRQIAQKLAAAP